MKCQWKYFPSAQIVFKLILQVVTKQVAAVGWE